MTIVDSHSKVDSLLSKVAISHSKVDSLHNKVANSLHNTVAISHSTVDSLNKVANLEVLLAAMEFLNQSSMYAQDMVLVYHMMFAHATRDTFHITVPGLSNSKPILALAYLMLNQMYVHPVESVLLKINASVSIQ